MRMAVHAIPAGWVVGPLRERSLGSVAGEAPIGIDEGAVARVAREERWLGGPAREPDDQRGQPREQKQG